MVLQIKTKLLRRLANETEITTQAAEEKLSDYIIALQGYFRKQEDDFTDYYIDNRKKLSRINPVNPEKLTGDDKPLNKPLLDFVNGYNFRKQEDNLLTILKFIHHNTTFFGITNAITIINQVAKIKGYKKLKKKKKSLFKWFKQLDITDVVEYANSPQFAMDAQSYITDNYDEFLTGAKEISKNIDSHTSSLIYNQLYEGVENLESMDDLAVRVGNVYDSCSQSRAITIARTETLRAFDVSTIDSYKVAKIEKAQILVSDDERLCNICLHLQGLVMPVDEARSCLPMHPRGRCTWIAVIGEPILKEPKLADVQQVIRDNPKIPIAKFIKVPKIKIPKISTKKPIRIPKKPSVIKGPARGHVFEGRPTIHMDKKIKLLQDDASKIGIKISKQKAKELITSINDFTGGGYSRVSAYNKGGEKALKEWLVKKNIKVTKKLITKTIRDAKNIEEYLRIAPRFAEKTKVFRGVDKGRKIYSKLSKGSTIDMQGSISFSSNISKAANFADETTGVIFELKEAPNLSSSIRHISGTYTEQEVLISHTTRYNVIGKATRMIEGEKMLIIKLAAI